MHKFAVFGNPIHHSLSPDIQNQFAKQTGFEISYDKILTPVDEFVSSVKAFINQGANGFNITVPFKLDAFKFANELTLNAKIAGSVNTIKIEANKIIGENSDGIGLIKDLTHNIGIKLKSKVILILGAGGATQGILFPILKQNPNQVIISNRTHSKAIRLAKNFSKFGNTCSISLNKIKHESIDIIINATSASLDGRMPNIAFNVANNTVCYDLMYGYQTPFMSWAKTNRAKMISDGLGMLVEQAAIAFEFWTGAKPDTKKVLSNLRR
ncbi:MAG: shikimate dehydrogenase [Candidatus Vesicomyosocius endoextente]|uniref:Shikimate dehydrogenase (NADP(+)) n=1 Tax=Candidatus Vesicomyosocius endoextente TaxID=2738853 RepID=A0A853G1T0_9GAMM|nr:shikimate dehydrogenase [Candidatus Vesicomyosocius endoextente]